MDKWLQIAVLCLGAARLNILITRDSILDPIRDKVFHLSPPENSDKQGWYFQNYRIKWGRLVDGTVSSFPVRTPGAIGEIISCPDCCGVWVALLVVGAWWIAPQTTLHVATVGTVALMASLIARKGGY